MNDAVRDRLHAVLLCKFLILVHVDGDERNRELVTEFLQRRVEDLARPTPPRGELEDVGLPDRLACGYLVTHARICAGHLCLDRGNVGEGGGVRVFR